MRRPLPLLVFALASAGCPDVDEDIGDPQVRFTGTVELAVEIAPKPDWELVVSFGEAPVEPASLVGASTWVHSYDGRVLRPTSFPASFDIGDLGIPYSGQGIAVLDLDGDGIIDPNDLVGELSFGAGEFDDTGTLAGLVFLVDAVER